MANSLKNGQEASLYIWWKAIKNGSQSCSRVIHMIHAEYREQGTQFSTNLCAWKCVFNYAVLGTSECVYLAARVSCILYLAPCLWREWMNNFRLSVAESSLRIKSRARKVCSVNHRARPLFSYLTKVGGGVGGRRDLPSSCGSGLAHNSLACAVGEFTSRSPRNCVAHASHGISEFLLNFHA